MTLVSGIVGLYDSSGPDPGMVRRAVLGGPVLRGAPKLRTVDGWVLGILGDEGRDPRVVETADSAVVVDARVDAILDPLVAGLGEGGAGLFAGVLSALGPAGLQNVAGDFAAAHLARTTGMLTLARDAFGLRPLFWAARGGRLGFASDIETLIEMGLADGAVDVEAVRTMLFEQGEYGDRTSFAGIRRVVAGRWVQLTTRGAFRGGRWFRPERVPPDPTMSLFEAGQRTRDAILAAVADRARGGVALFLSAGRDSSAVAVALAEIGVKAVCLTYSFDLPGVYTEAPQARDLARSLGHEWREVPVHVGVPPERASELGAIIGRPVNGVGAPIQLAMYDVIRELQPDVVMSGEGGDLLFSAFPIAILDLIRHGKLRRAIETARAFDRTWGYAYPFVAKVLVRGIAPRALLVARERSRERAPWLVRPARVRVRTDRSDAGYLRHLMTEGSDMTESPERLFQAAGASAVWPLVDLRVVDVALRFPVELRLPYPAPKQVLDAALLGERG